jgi:hypothetical protein
MLRRVVAGVDDGKAGAAEIMVPRLNSPLLHCNAEAESGDSPHVKLLDQEACI